MKEGIKRISESVGEINADVAKALDEYIALQHKHSELQGAHIDPQKEHIDVLAENKRLRDALSVYADEANWRAPYIGVENSTRQIEMQNLGLNEHGFSLAAKVLEETGVR